MRLNRRQRFFVVAGSLGCALGVTWVASRHSADKSPKILGSLRPFAPFVPQISEEPGPRGLALPTGEPTELRCAEARAIVRDARRLLAVPPSAVDPKRLALGMSDWLDPHGLWTAAPDSRTRAAILRAADALLVDLEGPGDGCPTTHGLAQGLKEEVLALRKVAVSAREEAREDARQSATSPSDLDSLCTFAPFEDGPVVEPAEQLAHRVGKNLGALDVAFPEARARGDLAMNRLLPDLEGDRWEGLLLSAMVRAYVPLLDPHGAWAPLDEETSIYDLALEPDPPLRLWSDMTRTTLGAYIDEGALPPLRDGDVVLRIRSLELAGLGIEAANQSGVVSSDESVPVEVLRDGSIVRLSVPDRDRPAPLARPQEEDAEIVGERVAYGKGEALVIRASSVPDDLGENIASAILESASPPEGVILDLRGNGGGSTDGALGTLGIFLPGAPLFPMKRRDGVIEIDRAPRLPEDLVWRGPVAALVDGDSASAAEMIAGALYAYQRGPILGGRTYGKGCAQEYVDDRSGRGVLRVTTLVFSLPDGSPLQQVGITPDVALGLPRSREREAELEHAPSAWRGPDVREKRAAQAVTWPAHMGRIGKVDDPLLGQALRALGDTKKAARKAR